jgi:hypothetical protein
MPTDPFPSEQVHDRDFEQLVADICARPGMYVAPVTFGSVCAYLSGFDAARSGGPMAGLHPWLVSRWGDGNNLNWTGLARRQLPTGSDEAGLADEELAIHGLGLLLGEFFEFRRANGLTKLFHDYAQWLLAQEWYTGPLRTHGGAST